MNNEIEKVTLRLENVKDVQELVGKVVEVRDLGKDTWTKVKVGKVIPGDRGKVFLNDHFVWLEPGEEFRLVLEEETQDPTAKVVTEPARENEFPVCNFCGQRHEVPTLDEYLEGLEESGLRGGFFEEPAQPPAEAPKISLGPREPQWVVTLTANGLNELLGLIQDLHEGSVIQYVTKLESK